jgi:copper resistance protein C
VPFRSARGHRPPARWPAVPSRSRRAVAVATFAAALVLASASPARAHTTLVSSTPANGATVRTAPAAVTLTFNEPVRGNGSVVTVTGPDGSAAGSGRLVVRGAVVTQPLVPLAAAGRFTVRYAVRSLDGHTVRGQRVFTFASPGGTGGGSPAPGAAPPAASAPAVPGGATAPPRESAPATQAPAGRTEGDPGRDGGTTGPAAAGLVLGAGMLAAASALVFVLRRRRIG